MSRIFVNGIGSISPAGWGVNALRDAIAKNEAIASPDFARPGWTKPLHVRLVPKPSSQAAFFMHARLRRTGAMSQHTVGAALEAIGDHKPKRLGIIVAMLSGLVAYTRRFYEEVLRDPTTASPLLFPETVFNAPGSHLAAYLGTTAQSYTLVGDDGMFVQGLALAAQWLTDGDVDGCVVIGAEELDWLVPDALRLFTRQAIYASGAGAVYLTSNSIGAMAELDLVTDSFSFSSTQDRKAAAKKARGQFPQSSPGDLLCASTCERPRYDEAETAAWADWKEARIQPKAILGEAFTASAAWQCVAACEAVARGNYKAANVSVVGVSQQAIGARFCAVNG